MNLSPVLTEVQADTLQVVSFRLENEIYSLDILCVQEIIKALPVTQVPLTVSWIEGVINLRGQILPLINLASRLGLKPSPYQRDTRFVIVRGREQNVGLVVDEVQEVLRLPVSLLEPAPTTAVDKDYIQAVCKYENRLVIVLDLPKVLYDNKPRPETLQEVI
ncbi:MAG: chemotaxis protein CheW [Candidatus Sericytochromatia bacterium]|nr:chemotaxis protein CheW [Candidatus Sericytochromatia bacterium]